MTTTVKPTEPRVACRWCQKGKRPNGDKCDACWGSGTRLAAYEFQTESIPCSYLTGAAGIEDWHGVIRPCQDTVYSDQDPDDLKSDHKDGLCHHCGAKRNVGPEGFHNDGYCLK